MVRLVALAAGIYVYKEPPKGLVGKARDDAVVRHAYIESTRPLPPLEGRTLQSCTPPCVRVAIARACGHRVCHELS